MLDIQPAREAPIKPPLQPSGTPAGAIHSKEEVLALENIQGNIVGGFRKDHQTMLFLKITNPVQFRVWLATLVPFIATAAEVLAFNRLFKELRRRRGESHRSVDLGQRRPLVQRTQGPGRPGPGDGVGGELQGRGLSPGHA